MSTIYFIHVKFLLTGIWTQCIILAMLTNETKIAPSADVRESIVPISKEAWLGLRAQDITSTETAALFGCSPYITHYELWHRKRQAAITNLSPNERMEWGTRLQDAIAHGLAEDNKLAIRAMPEYIRLPALRIGSSFDYRIIRFENAADCAADGLLEVKNVDSLAYREGWAVDDAGVEAPPHIEIQVQHQLLVSGLGFAKIGALVGGNKGTLIPRVRDEKIIAAIKSKVAAFWLSIQEGREPAPNFERDAEFIAKLHSFAEPGSQADMKADTALAELAREYKFLGDAAKTAEDGRKALKAKILLKIGDVEKVTGDGFTVTAGMIGPTHVEAFDKEGFRSFRINWKKEKRV